MFYTNLISLGTYLLYEFTDIVLRYNVIMILIAHYRLLFFAVTTTI